MHDVTLPEPQLAPAFTAALTLASECPTLFFDVTALVRLLNAGATLPAPPPATIPSFHGCWVYFLAHDIVSGASHCCYRYPLNSLIDCTIWDPVSPCTFTTVSPFLSELSQCIRWRNNGGIGSTLWGGGSWWVSWTFFCTCMLSKLSRCSCYILPIHSLTCSCPKSCQLMGKCLTILHCKHFASALISSAVSSPFCLTWGSYLLIATHGSACSHSKPCWLMGVCLTTPHSDLFTIMLTSGVVACPIYFIWGSYLVVAAYSSLCSYPEWPWFMGTCSFALQKDSFPASFVFTGSHIIC